MDIRVREMGWFDVPFVNEVRNLSVEYLHNKTKFSVSDTRLWFFRNGDPYFICDVNKIPVGYCRTSNWTDNSCYVGMDIRPDYRGNGYSKPLYRKLFKYLITNYNISEVFLEVLDYNKRAIHIYKSLGFKEIDRFRYGNDVSIKMKLEFPV